MLLPDPLVDAICGKQQNVNQAAASEQINSPPKDVAAITKSIMLIGSGKKLLGTRFNSSM
jgi:hypothetical protein